MITEIEQENILFLDIETVPQYANYANVPERMQKLWDKKALFIANEDQTPEEVYPRAGIYAEFGKTICISVGFLKRTTEGLTLRITSYANDDEKILLNEFAQLVSKHYNLPHHLLCGHNGKEFDFPYIARRMLINNIPIPSILNLSGKKPWDIKHLDTMVMWKFGDYKNYTSLDLLAAVFDIPTPKSDIDGSQVHQVYYQEKNLDRIVNYCEKDVATLVQVFRKINGLPLILPNNIQFV